MERRRFGLPGPSRTGVGVAALVAGALGLGLLSVPLFGDDGTKPVDSGARAKKAAAGPLGQDAAQERAVATGKRVEVTALRDETSTTYARPDGSFQLVAYGAPVRAKVDGVWKPLDTDLVRAEGGGWAPKAAADPVVFTAGGRGGSTTTGADKAVARTAGAGAGTGAEAGAGTGAATAARPAVFTVARSDATGAVRTAEVTDGYSELATLTSDGHEVTLSWPGTLPEPVVSGPSALYREVFDGVDLLLTAQDSGFSHVLIVHSAAAAANPALATLSYGLSSPDLTFSLDPVTKVVTAEDRDGDEFAVSPTPYLWDSAGTYAETEGDDPQPSAEPDEPSPSFSEEPGEDVDRESAGPEDGLDTEGPTPETLPEESPATGPAATPGDDATADPVTDDTTADPVTDDTTADPVTDDTTADPVAYRRTAAHGRTSTGAVLQASLSDDEVFALKGLAGPDPGTHLAVAGAELSDPGAASTALSIVPDAELLTAADTAYPVFIDPTIYGKRKNWTTAYKKYPTSSFYDGTNYNSGTTEARVGFESTTWGLSRSFFRLSWSTNIKGAEIKSASLRLRETYAWSCSAREMQVWTTSGISSKTTWNNQPDFKTQIGAKSFAHGYNSSCPDEDVLYSAKEVTQDAADAGWKELNFGLRATTEDSASAWKKFRAEGAYAPVLVIEYNRRPRTPSSLAQTPGGSCDRAKPYVHVGKRDMILSAASSDADDTSTRQDLKYLDFELWNVEDPDVMLVNRNVTVTSAGKASTTVLKSVFKDGVEYAWRVRALDESGAGSAYAPATKPRECHFVFDSSVPSPPVVTSDAFPAADEDGSVWSKEKLGTAGTFTFDPNGETDVTRFWYSFNTPTYTEPKTVTAGASGNTPPLNPPNAGPNVLYVRSVDSAGNVSPGTKYLFYVTPRDVGDVAGDVTGDTVPDLFVIDDEGDLSMYAASLGGDMHKALEAAHDNGLGLLAADPDNNNQPHLPGYWLGTNGKPALIAHGGDVSGGDGVGDLFARMPDGQLYVYPGDGYGSVDIAGRTKVRLPSGAPAPATLTQIIVGDYDVDGRADLFATDSAGTFWAFDGYTGVTFSTATKMTTTAWATRDLVAVGDFDKDGAPDLLFRAESSSRLLLRYGIKNGTAGSTVDSLATAGGSRTGADETYAEGWSTTATPVTHLYGTPDVTNDGVPDIWALAADGSVVVHKGGATAIGSGTVVISAGSGWATTKLAFG
ncbi:hypothetical protein OK074_4721 [Actinobacteria bacterium OK074]|nr:hypothetical protein OK074_4721 [Actinobacteria bacterium OK074]